MMDVELAVQSATENPAALERAKKPIRATA